MNGQIISFHASFKHFHFSQKRLFFPKMFPKMNIFPKTFPKNRFLGICHFSYTIKIRFYAILEHFELSEIFPKTSFKKTICYGTIALILKKAFSSASFTLIKTYNKILILLYFYLTIVGFSYILARKKTSRFSSQGLIRIFYSGYTLCLFDIADACPKT